MALCFILNIEKPVEEMEHVPLSPESEVGATREHVPLSPESEVGATREHVPLSRESVIIIIIYIVLSFLFDCLIGSFFSFPVSLRLTRIHGVFFFFSV
jgi:hypothetical protein